MTTLAERILRLAEQEQVLDERARLVVAVFSPDAGAEYAEGEVCFEASVGLAGGTMTFKAKSYDAALVGLHAKVVQYLLAGTQGRLDRALQDVQRFRAVLETVAAEEARPPTAKED